MVSKKLCNSCAFVESSLSIGRVKVLSSIKNFRNAFLDSNLCSYIWEMWLVLQASVAKILSLTVGHQIIKRQYLGEQSVHLLRPKAYGRYKL